MAVITVSREYGSGGSAIAGHICERLGYRFFDKQLMAQLGVPAELKAEFNEASSVSDPTAELGLVARFIRNLQAASPLGQQEGIRTENEMPQHAVERLIRIAYGDDRVVVVGRAGQMVLAGKPDVLHVRVVAPLEKRVQTVMQFEGLTGDVARERIERRDRAAESYLKQNYGVDAADPRLYDLVINTARLSYEAAAGLVIAALAELPPRPDEGARL